MENEDDENQQRSLSGFIDLSPKKYQNDTLKSFYYTINLIFYCLKMSINHLYKQLQLDHRH